jgi:hypothetical protein
MKALPVESASQARFIGQYIVALVKLILASGPEKLDLGFSQATWHSSHKYWVKLDFNIRFVGSL